jgi:hypothetical protein
MTSDVPCLTTIRIIEKEWPYNNRAKPMYENSRKKY